MKNFNSNNAYQLIDTFANKLDNLICELDACDTIDNYDFDDTNIKENTSIQKEIIKLLHNSGPVLILLGELLDSLDNIDAFIGQAKTKLNDSASVHVSPAIREAIDYLTGLGYNVEYKKKKPESLTKADKDFLRGPWS